MSDVRQCAMDFDERSLTVRWSQRSGGVTGPLAIALAIIVPGMGMCLTPVFLGGERNLADQLGAFGACMFLPMLLGALGAYAAAGRRVTLVLDQSGLKRTATYPLGFSRASAWPLPVEVRTAPLWGSADQLAPQTPMEWLLVFSPPGGEPMELLTVDSAVAERFKRASQVTRIPNAVLLPPDHEERSPLLCSGCGYDLHGLTSVVCPECACPLTKGQCRAVAAEIARHATATMGGRPSSSPLSSPPAPPAPPPLPGE